MDIVIASNNKHKIAELKEILGGHFGRIYSMAELGSATEPEETGETFLENALIKARAAAERFNIPALADDSGLIAAALGNNEPGVYSARYSASGKDIDNNNKLLTRLEGKPKTAYFSSAVVLYFPDGTFTAGEGRCYGKIIDSPRGTNGFGYDPIFLSDELNKTFAEASADEKNAISHRFRALADLLSKL